MDLNVFKDITYGMYIVSTIKDQEKVGCIINTLTQITSKDPIVTISLNKDNYTNKILKETKKCAIAILSKETPRDVITKFGFFSSKDEDKFKDSIYQEDSGLPVATDKICSYLIGGVLDIIDCNSHDIFMIKVIKTVKKEDLVPMTYKYYQEELKGKAPFKAPTYIEESKANTSSSCKYKCTVCGYIYDDAKEKVKFVDLPDDWKCPRCGVGKDKFVRL